MKLPYGISNFEKLRKEEYLYIDKTDFIERIERLSSNYLFFIRPRRFGKSLFLSTLANYYDLNNKDRFEDLFANLYIGKNPTELKTSYFILKLNFSGLNTDNKERLRESFRLNLINSIRDSLNIYQNYFENISEIEKKLETTQDIKAVFEYFLKAVKQENGKIYLIIDEYDHFANDIIAMGDSNFYRKIIRATGFVRDFYETVKIGTESVIDRIFITGISPIMLDELTSGFNIATNLTLNKIFNGMLGFTETEVKNIIKLLELDDQKEKLLDKLQKNYDGYLFSKNAQQTLYNPDMILNFFNQWLMTGNYPEKLIDDNVRTDYGRLNRLIANEKNRQVVEGILADEGITTDIVTRFSFDRMYDQEYFVSLLYYMGLLTIKGERYGKIRLSIPNHVTRVIFWEYFERKLRDRYNIEYDTEELAKSIWHLGFDGEIEPFVSYVSENVLKKLSNRDLINFDEKYIKVILFSYLITSNLYRPVSEPEIENGYLDIFLAKDIRMPDVKYEWVIELKYIKKNEKDRLAKVKEEGLNQLERYANSRKFKNKKNVKNVVLVFIGKDEFKIFNQ